ncbi:hypothetical protein BaRGS_00011387, partial [Batillaria attramentaria]
MSHQASGLSITDCVRSGGANYHTGFPEGMVYREIVFTCSLPSAFILIALARGSGSAGASFELRCRSKR